MLFKELEILQKNDELSLLELEFGRFLESIDSEISNNVIIAGMCCVQKQISGHICCSISDIISNSVYAHFLEFDITKEDLINDIQNSKIIGQLGDKKPLILDGENLYLQKLLKYEKELADFLILKSKNTHKLEDDSKNYVDQLFKEDPSTENLQKIAVLLALVKDLIIITGGPGTGKTFTVRKIIEVLHFKNKKYNIGLATPTGKAAQRLNESLDIKSFKLSINPAITIHKLLQANGKSGTFLYNEKNKLPIDVLIIDEASMLDINLWIRLIRALPKNVKLILLGDKNQLASVEAGSILGDVCSGATNKSSAELNDIVSLIESSSVALNEANDCIIELTKSHRFDKKSGIGILSSLINFESTEVVIGLLKDKSYPDINIIEPTNDTIENLIQEFVIQPFIANKENGFSFESLKKYQILCALRKGPFGVDSINDLAEKKLKKILGITFSEEWYEGRPILFTRNNSLLKVRNGEIGICIRNKNTGLFEIQLEQKETSPISVSRIQDYEPSFATTIHKSQGSEYDHISIMLSNHFNPLLSKQLLYTAVTRARKSVLVIARESIITSTVKNNIVRRSGLSQKIWKS